MSQEEGKVGRLEGPAEKRLHVGPQACPVVCNSRILFDVTCWRKVGCFALSAMVVGSTCFTTLAAPTWPIALIYDAPPECPREGSVAERTSALMRYQPTTPILARAKITRQIVGYRLELDVEGGQQRVLSETCDSLVQTLAVILAMAADLQARESAQSPNERHGSKPDKPGMTATPAMQSIAPPPPASAGAPALTTAAPVPPTAAPVPSALTFRADRGPPPLRSSSIRAVTTPRIQPAVVQNPAGVAETFPQSHRNAELSLSTQLLTEYGMLRGLAEGPSLGLWIDLDAWSFTATAEWIIPQWKQMPDVQQKKGGTISFLGAQITPCLALSQSRTIHTCAGVEIGDMMGKGSGVSIHQLGHGVWFAGTAALGWRPRISSKVSGDLRLGMAIPMKRPAFGFADYSWRFEPFPWSLRVSSGFSWF